MKNAKTKKTKLHIIREGMSRRDALRALGLTGGAACLASLGFRPTRAFAQEAPPNLACAGQGYTEVYPTSPLILDPFTDPLPIPLPLAPSDPSTWGTPPPQPRTGGVQDSRGGLHQLGCADLGLPQPIYYRIPLQVGAHSFTSSKVLPIDSGGNLVNGATPGYGFLPETINPGVGLSLPDSTIYGFNGAFPGALIKAQYGRPVCIRFVNELHHNPLNLSRNDFGMEEFLTHLHNGHTAPESDGNPNYLQSGHYNPGEWCDNLYLNWPAGGDDSEKQSFLWFHDHTHDHTGANVFKGMVGLYPIYDPALNKDNGNETKGYRLPGVTDPITGAVNYDIPLAFYDTCLDDGVTQHKDFHNGCGETHPEWWGQTFFRDFPNHGFVGDVFTVNCKAYPVLRVKRRRYRLRFLDASVARGYELVLMSSTTPPVAAITTGRNGVKLQGQYQLPGGEQCMKMVQIAVDGGLLQYPFLRNSIEIWPAKRREVIVDFSKYMDGSPTCSNNQEEVIYLVNVMEMTNGRKPNHPMITHDPVTDAPLNPPIPDPEFDPDFRVPMMKIIIEPGDVPDNSLDPLDYVNKDSNGNCTLKLALDNQNILLPVLKMRPGVNLPRSFRGFTTRDFELQRGGTLGGEHEWLINGAGFLPSPPLAYPLKGAGELWTLRNGGGGWTHPMHMHQEEHRVLTRNGVPPQGIGADGKPKQVKDPSLYNVTYNGHDHPDDMGREDTVQLDPGEEVVIWRKFRTFTGPYVAHCHNLAHEDHSMMFGFNII